MSTDWTHERQNGPPTCEHFGGPAGLLVSGGDGSPKGLDEANHSQGWLLHHWGEDAFKQSDLIVSALDDGVIKERVGRSIACGKDDSVNGLKCGPVLKHSWGLHELCHTGPDGQGATQDAWGELIVEHRLFPQGAVKKQESQAFAVKCLVPRGSPQQPIAWRPNLNS